MKSKKTVVTYDRTGSSERFQLAYKRAIINSTIGSVSCALFGMEYTNQKGETKTYSLRLTAPKKAIDAIKGYDRPVPNGAFRCWCTRKGWRTFYYSQITRISADGTVVLFDRQPLVKG